MLIFKSKQKNKTDLENKVKEKRRKKNGKELDSL